MASFNSKEYAWIDVNVVLLGKPVAGLRAIEYKSKSRGRHRHYIMDDSLCWNNGGQEK